MKNPFTGMLERARELFSKRFIQVIFLLSLLLVLLSALLPIWQLMPGIQERIAVPLHYNIHFGVDLFGAWWRVFTVPVIGLTILVVNFTAAVFLWRREKVLSYFFASVTFISQVLLFVAMVFIVLLNLTYA